MSQNIKHIVIDARLYGPKNTGIGRYTKNLLLFLKKTRDFSKYKITVIISKNDEQEAIKNLGRGYDLVVTGIPHYSWQEQILLPFVLYKLKPDLVHFTHFNKPVFFFGNSVVTVHDLIKHYFRGSETTTKNGLLYWSKHLGYLFISFMAIKTSRLIVPSNYWREIIIKKFSVDPNKIRTIYEAADPKFKDLPADSAVKPEDYIVYTGNLYPHKNISVVIEALKKIPTLKLKIICARSIFLDRLKKRLSQTDLKDRVDFLGYIDDAAFDQVYSRAIALVHPSLMEGFSLTGLEAMALNCPVISSNSSCLPEIYGDSVMYFDPKNPEDLAQKISSLRQSGTLRHKLILLGKKQLPKYSWQRTAIDTLDVYEESLT